MRKFTEILKKGEEGLMSVLEMVKSGRLKGYETVIRRAQKKLTESGAERYFDFGYKDGEFRIIRKEQEIQKAIALCGYYVLETTEVGMSDSEVEENYKKLQQVERIFRELKDLIEIRPVFHWKDRCVRTHVFLCIIAQSILRLCRVRLKEAGWFDDGSSMEDFMNFLNEIKLGQFNIDSVNVYKVQKLSERHKEILSRFGIKTIEFDVMKRQMIL